MIAKKHLGLYMTSMLHPLVNNKPSSGFTLIEILIYIGLFMIVIGGGMVATYQIIESTNKTNGKTIIFEDAGFLQKKLDWVLNGATSVTTTSTSMTANGQIFLLNDSNLELDGKSLNSSFVKISQSANVGIPVDMFTYDNTTKKLDISFMVNDQRFDETRYLH